MPNSGAAAPRARGTSTACAGATHRSAPSCSVSRVSGPPQTENSVGPARLSTVTTLPPGPRSSAERPAAVARVRPVNPTRALGRASPSGTRGGRGDADAYGWHVHAPVMVSGAQNAKNAGAGHEPLQSGASVVPHGGLRVERDCLVNSRISRMMLFKSMVVAQPPRASIAAQFLAIALALGVSEGHPFFRTRRTDCPLQIVSLMTRLAASESFLAAHFLAATVVKNAPCGDPVNCATTSPTKPSAAASRLASSTVVAHTPFVSAPIHASLNVAVARSRHRRSPVMSFLAAVAWQRNFAATSLPTALIFAPQHMSEADEPTALAGSVSRARVAHANAIPRRTMPLRSLARESARWTREVNMCAGIVAVSANWIFHHRGRCGRRLKVGHGTPRSSPDCARLVESFVIALACRRRL